MGVKHMNKIFRLRISDARFDNLKSKIQNPKSKSGPADENGWVKGEEEKAR
jgi:hypothetical protein